MQLLLHIIQSPVRLLIVIRKNVTHGKIRKSWGMYLNADTNHPGTTAIISILVSLEFI